jgi:hypothetical protein
MQFRIRFQNRESRTQILTKGNVIIGKHVGRLGMEWRRLPQRWVDLAGGQAISEKPQGHTSLKCQGIGFHGLAKIGNPAEKEDTTNREVSDTRELSDRWCWMDPPGMKRNGDRLRVGVDW